MCHESDFARRVENLHKPRNSGIVIETTITIMMPVSRNLLELEHSPELRTPVSQFSPSAADYRVEAHDKKSLVQI